MTRTTTLLVTLVFATMALQAGTTLAKGGNGDKHSGGGNRNGSNRSSMSSNKMMKTSSNQSNQSNNNKHCNKNCGTQQQPPFHCGTGQPGTVVDPVHKPPFHPPVMVDPVLVTSPIVRDHRTPKFPPLSGGNGQGGVTVTSTGGFNGIVRDHRGTTSTAGSVVKTLGSGVSAVGNGLEHAAGTVAGTVGRGVSSVGHAAGSAAGKVAGTVGRGASAIGSGVKDAAGAVGDFFGF